MENKGWINSGRGAPDCDLTLTPSKNMKLASAESEREYLEYSGGPIVGYAVAGGDAHDDRFVTDNSDQTGKSVQSTTIGSLTSTANRGCFSIAGAQNLAAHGEDYVDILQHYFRRGCAVGACAYKFGSAASRRRWAPWLALQPASPPPAPAKPKLLADFEHDDRFLGPAATSHVAQTNISHIAIQSTSKGLDSNGAEQLTIDYDEKHAKGAPFTFRALTGVGSGGKGTEPGNTLLPADGELGFMIRTKMPGLTTQILVNDHSNGAIDKSATRSIVADGHWHLYSWQINSSKGWKPFAKGQPYEQLTGGFTLNSILVNGASDASLSLDDVVYAENPNTPGGSYNLNYSGSAGTLNSSSNLINFGGSTMVGAGTLTLARPYPGGYLNTGTVILGSTSTNLNGGATIVFNGGTLNYGQPGIGTFQGNGLRLQIPSPLNAPLLLTQGGTISTIVGSLNDYPLGPGTELSPLDNGALLLSGGTFGDGGLLLLNSGTLALTDASVAPQFANLAQSSGIAGTVLTPEPVSASLLGLSSIALLRRRRSRHSL